MTDLREFEAGLNTQDLEKLGAIYEQTHEMKVAAHRAHDTADEAELQAELELVLGAMNHPLFEAGVRMLSNDQRGALLEQQEAITQAAREANNSQVNAPDVIKEERRLRTILDITQGRQR